MKNNIYCIDIIKWQLFLDKSQNYILRQRKIAKMIIKLK